MSVKYLFNSRGKHIANLVNGQLYLPAGKNIGHYLENEKIFINMHGRYLGELIFDNRLVMNRNSPYKSINLGIYGNYGNVGNYGNPGKYDSIGIPGGYKDIPSEVLL